jgi:hypothetical protein
MYWLVYSKNGLVKLVLVVARLTQPLDAAAADAAAAAAAADAAAADAAAVAASVPVSP